MKTQTKRTRNAADAVEPCARAAKMQPLRTFLRQSMGAWLALAALPLYAIDPRPTPEAPALDGYAAGRAAGARIDRNILMALLPNQEVAGRHIRAILKPVLSALLALATFPAIAFETDPGNPNPENCLYSVDATLLRATPASVEPGTNTTLEWAVNMPSDCTGVTLTLSGQAVYGTSGTLIRAPFDNSTYDLVAKRFGTTRFLGSVSVAAEYPLPTGSTVNISGSTVGHADLLRRALEAGGKDVVLAPHVDIDLSGTTVALGKRTTLRSSEPRGPGNLGPRIFVADHPRPLLLIRCYDDGNSGTTDDAEGNVRISGFRLQGPNWDSASGDENLERGIMIDSCRKVEVSNMELSGWSGQAIYVTDDLNNIDGAEDVKVRDNFIHHNQHVGTSGYGVVSKAGANVLIERNVFDYNRHAVAADGGWFPGSYYVARHNLVLKGGGFHDRYPVYGDYHTHQFDVHGTTDCGPLFFNAGLSCGEAGIYFEWTDNAVQYTRGVSLKVRGNPFRRPLAARNVFASSSGNAIKQNGWDYEGRIHAAIDARDNRFGTDSYGRYGVCDFDGDGADDLFLATGANWWWSSGGKFPWSFLRAATERLGDVGLGDFDGDGRCDVLAGNPFNISPGGTGAWTELPGGNGASMDSLRFGDFNGDGRTDIFRRDPQGRWWIVSPGVHGWEEINNSALQLKDLRFGHFDGDAITDIIAVVGGRWHVSWGGRSAWEKVNDRIGANLSNLIVIGDIDGNGIDDIVNYNLVNTGVDSKQRPLVTMNMTVSIDARRNWTTLGSMQLAPGDVEVCCGWYFPTPLIGRFEGPHHDPRLWIADRSRNGLLFDYAQRSFAPHGLSPY